MLEQLLVTQQQQAAMPANTSDPQMMMGSSHHPSVPHNTPSLYHSLGTRPQYNWTAPDILSSCLQLDRDLFSTANILSDEGRRELINAYPALRNVEYRAPLTLPAAQKCMNKAQQLEDSSLRDLQYLLSGVFRPLDILGHEMLQSSGVPDTDLERLFNILNHARTLLINACSTITYSRNKIAMRAVNPRFSAPDPSASKRYTMTSEDFHQAITQQTSTAKVLNEARIDFRSSKRPANKKFSRPPKSGNQLSGTTSSFPSTDPQPFFRSGQSSQRGGYQQQAKRHTANRSNSLLADRTLAPSPTVNGNTTTSGSDTRRHSDNSYSSTMDSTSQVEISRLAALNAAYSNPELTATTGDLLRTPRLEDNSTNRSYKRGQSLFIEWALKQDISMTNLTEVHVANLLSTVTLGN